MDIVPDDPKYTWLEACALGIVRTYFFKGKYWHPSVDRTVELYVPARSLSDAWERVLDHSEGEFIYEFISIK
jgi:hypothetical protein